MFVGDSITDAKMWTAYITAYLLLRFPTEQLHITSYGRGGADAADFLYVDDPYAGASHGGSGYQHWPRNVAPMGSNWQIIMLGQNPSVSADNYDIVMRRLLSNYATGTQFLVAPWPATSSTGGSLDTYEAKLATIASDTGRSFFNTFTTLLPIWTSCKSFTVDHTTNTLTCTAHGFTDGTKVYIDLATAPSGLSDGSYFVRDATTNTLKLSLTSGGSVVDFTTNGSGTHYISSVWAKLQYPGTQSSATGHQGTTGHAILAQKTIVGLGWGTDVFHARLNMATEISATGCTTSSRSTNIYSGVDFTLLPSRLPWAYDRGANNRTYNDAVSIVPEFAGWQSAIIEVDGLTSGDYEVYMNGSLVATIADTVLAAGWNVSDLTTGPIYEKCNSVLTAIRSQLGVQNGTGDFVPPLNTSLSPLSGMEKYGSAASAEFNSGKRDSALAAALADEIALIDTMDQAIWALATPSSIQISIRKVGAVPVVPNVRTKIRPRRV